MTFPSLLNDRLCVCVLPRQSTSATVIVIKCLAHVHANLLFFLRHHSAVSGSILINVIALHFPRTSSRSQKSLTYITSKSSFLTPRLLRINMHSLHSHVQTLESRASAVIYHPESALGGETIKFDDSATI